MNILIDLLKKNEYPIKALFAECASQVKAADPQAQAACYFNDLVALIEDSHIRAARQETSSPLLECDFYSIVAAAAKAIKAGVVIAHTAPQAFIVRPFDEMDNKAKLVLSAKGYHTIALRTNLVKKLGSEIIKQGQIKKFDPIKGHEIDFGLTYPNQKTIGVLAYIKLNNGYSASLYMTDEEVEEWGKKYNQDFDDPEGFWQNDRPKMAKKTALKCIIRDHAPFIVSAFHLSCGDITAETTRDFLTQYQTANTETPQTATSQNRAFNVKASEPLISHSADTAKSEESKQPVAAMIKPAAGKKMPVTESALRDLAQSVIKGELSTEQVENNQYYEMNAENIARFHEILAEEKGKSENGNAEKTEKRKRSRKPKQEQEQQQTETPIATPDTPPVSGNDSVKAESPTSPPQSQTTEETEKPDGNAPPTPVSTPVHNEQTAISIHAIQTEATKQDSQPKEQGDISDMIKDAFSDAEVVITPATTPTPTKPETDDDDLFN